MDDDAASPAGGTESDPDIELAALRTSAAAESRRREGWIRDRLMDESEMLGILLGAVGQRVKVSVRGSGELHQQLCAVNSEVLQFEAGSRVTWVNAAALIWAETVGPVQGAGSPPAGSWVQLLGDLEIGRFVALGFIDGSTFDGELLGVGAVVSVSGQRGEIRHADPVNIACVSQHL